MDQIIVNSDTKKKDSSGNPIFSDEEQKRIAQLKEKYGED